MLTTSQANITLPGSLLRAGEMAIRSSQPSTSPSLKPRCFTASNVSRASVCCFNTPSKRSNRAMPVYSSLSAHPKGYSRHSNARTCWPATTPKALSAASLASLCKAQPIHRNGCWSTPLMTMILLPLLPFSAIQLGQRSLFLPLMQLAGGNSCFCPEKEKKTCCTMRKYVRLFNRLEELAIPRLAVGASIPSMPRSPKPFLKDVSLYWVTLHTSCLHLVD